MVRQFRSGDAGDESAGQRPIQRTKDGRQAIWVATRVTLVPCGIEGFIFYLHHLPAR